MECKNCGNEMDYLIGVMWCCNCGSIVQPQGCSPDQWRFPKNLGERSEPHHPMLSDVLAEDLKCCGNCSERMSINMGDEYHEICAVKMMPSDGYCDKWEYDRLSNKDRQVY